MEGGRSASLEVLGQVKCRVTPKFGAKEKAALDSVEGEEAWPWFSVVDDTVLFEQPDSPWFLAGRAVASYECR